MNPPPRLTPTEECVYRLIRKACSDKEIAGELGMSHGAVRFHIGNLFQKFNVHKRIALVLALLPSDETNL